jgi:hypothetical protein
VLIPGAGSGRQYRYLLDAGFEPQGFDISRKLVAVCRERFPSVPTWKGSVTDAAARAGPVDAVLTSAVLQHVRPDEIEEAVAALKTTARKLIIIREATRLDVASEYQFAHDYGPLFLDWEEAHRETTDEAANFTTEMIAFRSRDVQGTGA